MFKLNWQEGRQGTGYRKLTLWQSALLSCDGYLIKYPSHSHIPTHTDPVPNKKHYRLNILLKGEDKFKGDTIFSTKRIKFFRPDIMPHSVEEVAVPRLILSIGWAIRN
jgi:hypothetical protein